MYIEDFSFEIELRELKFARDRTGDKKSIGEGSFSRIFLAEWNGTPCAVKRMTKQQAGQMALERFQVRGGAAENAVFMSQCSCLPPMFPDLLALPPLPSKTAG